MIRSFLYYLMVLLGLFLFAFCKNEGRSDLRESSIELGKCVWDKEGVVSCAHPEAARIGAEILQQGGNAFDAAIAMQWALAVCYPEAGNIGGGGFMVARKSDGSYLSLDFRESAPAAAHRAVYLDSDGERIEAKSTDTHYAAGVPGTVRGLYECHRRLSRMDMPSLIDPAIALAREGFPLTARQARYLNEHAETLRERNGAGTAFTRSGEWQVGDSLRQEDLAATLERISQAGEEEFYSGYTAELILAEMRQAEAWFQAEDLANYRAHWREPISCDWRGSKVVGMGPPSSGGIALCQLLAMADLLGLDSLQHNDLNYIHRFVEAQRRVYADRSEHLGDPDFYAVPVEQLLDAGYIAARVLDIDLLQASPSAEVLPGQFAGESMETTHLSLIDAEGNAVAVTTTLNGLYGSKIVVEGAGFFLNNEMDDFSTKAGSPNMFGLIGGEANAVEAGKRMLSSMTPTIVERDGALFMALGSPGGSTIITSVLQTLLNTLHFDMPPDSAIAAAKFHSQWLPDKVFFEEGRFRGGLLDSLAAMGHTPDSLASLGRMDLAVIQPDGTRCACGDLRADNTAAGHRANENP